MITTATVPTNSNVVSYLTQGKTYEIIELREHGFDIIDDSGEKITASRDNDLQLGYLNENVEYINWIFN